MLKEYTPKESMIAVKELLKRKRLISKADLKPGHLIYSRYNAKDKTQTFDRTPLVLILLRNKRHTLGLNFHWVPFSMRINLVKHIININKANIVNRKPLKFSYKQLKPMLKSLGYAPVIRLYINRRFGKDGVVIPANRLMEIARMKTQTFTNGKYSSGEMLAMARRKHNGNSTRRK